LNSAPSAAVIVLSAVKAAGLVALMVPRYPPSVASTVSLWFESIQI
jgi:hypothetical protein